MDHEFKTSLGYSMEHCLKKKKKAKEKRSGNREGRKRKGKRRKEGREKLSIDTTSESFPRP